MNIRVVFYKFEYINAISDNKKEPYLRFFFCEEFIKLTPLNVYVSGIIFNADSLSL